LVEEALTTAVLGTRLGTLAASLAAAASYASLGLTTFRGFRQFGVIGGLGLTLSWVAAFVLTPPLVAWIDRRPSLAPAPIRSDGPMSRLAGWLSRRFRTVLLVSTLLTAAAASLLPRLGPERIESDFSKLRRSDTRRTGEGYWGRRMDALLGRYLTPIVFLTDDSADARAARDDLGNAIQVPPLSTFVSRVVAIDDLVPRDQGQKLGVAMRIQRILAQPTVRSVLEQLGSRSNDVVGWLSRLELTRVEAADLPPGLTKGLRETDGTLDRIVDVYPRPSEVTWQGDAISTMTDSLRSIADPHRARVAGSIPLSADIISSLLHDGPIATFAALLSAVLLVALIFRGSRITAFVIGSLLLGVSWLTAITIAADIKINFANFIAFPITFGIGVDYSVNMMARYVRENRDVGRALRSTGGAVALCSLTTIIGYSSLLFARNNALFLFGVVAVLGEICCLATALLVLPAVLLAIARWTDGWRTTR
jgi:predicted RND superfamily exporter protein